MKKIKFREGIYTIVDDDDYERFDETNRECPREDANGHRIDQDGKLVYDERCHNCDAPKEKQDWETLIDEQIDSIDEGLAIKKDEPNRLGIYTSATNLGTRKIEIKSIIRKEKELSKEEGRRESEVYCACGDMLEKDWLGFGGRVCASCEPVEREKIAEESRLAVIAEVEKYWETEHKNCGDDCHCNHALHGLILFLKTNSK